MPVNNLTPPERETTITSTDADGLVRIWTAQRPFITRMRNHPAFTEVDSGHHGTSDWASFTIPADQWNPASGAKRRVTMTDEQKAAAGARLRAARTPGISANAHGASELQNEQGGDDHTGPGAPSSLVGTSGDHHSQEGT